jgi:hypothetical protein
MKRAASGLVWLLAFGLLTGAPAPAFAQAQVEITAPPPERAPLEEFVIPGLPPDVSRPREQDFYPDDVRTRHDPAFIAPLSTTIPTGPRTAARVGLSAWTAPKGRGDLQVSREIGGWFAVGISFVWDILVEAEPPKPAPAPSRR